MAQIVVEQGSYWAQGPPPKLLRPGIYEVPDDSPYVAEVAACEMPTVYVVGSAVPVQVHGEPDPSEQEALDKQLPEVVDPPLQVVDTVKPQDGSGTMTSADLPTSNRVACPICEGKDFANRGALSSHVRARHTHLDPVTLQPRETVDSETQAPPAEGPTA